MTTTSPPDLSEACLLDLLHFVGELGRMLVERQATVKFTYKNDGSILSDLDVEVQRRIRDFVGGMSQEEARTAHFVGEEEEPGMDVSRVLAPNRWNWIVDAIDGTAAYTKGVNTFGISIALVDDACRPVVGIIHLPGWKRRFDVAWRGGLYSWGGEDLEPAGESSLPAGWLDARTAPVSRSYVYGNSDLHRRGLETFRGKVRNLGGTAAHLALLAERSDDPIAVILSRCRVWDVAAGLALADAAGMEVRHGTDWQLLPYEALICDDGLQRMLPVVVGMPEVLAVLEKELRGKLH